MINSSSFDLSFNSHSFGGLLRIGTDADKDEDELEDDDEDKSEGLLFL